MADANPRDCWETPPDFWAWVRHNYDPNYDICATDENTKCTYYVTPEEDALSRPWMDFAAEILDELGRERPVFWCNPGYSDILPWVDRAIESAKSGGVVVMLTHDNWFSRWFRQAYAYADEIYLLTPRIQFIAAPGVKASTPRGNNILWVFRYGVENKTRALRIRLMDWQREDAPIQPGPRGCDEEVTA